MPKVTFIEHSGVKHEVDAEIDKTLMETAISNAVPGIDADCGGACACATCHVYINGDWGEKLGKPNDMEASMLEFSDSVRPTSRLSCQIKVTSDMDGIEIELPEAQH